MARSYDEKGVANSIPAKTRPAVNQKQELGWISWGVDARWVPLSVIAEQFQKAGIDYDEGRVHRQMKRWKVPVLTFPRVGGGKVKVVDRLSFVIACRAIGRIGRKDFVGLGVAQFMRKGIPYDAVNQLELEYLTEDIDWILAEIVVSRRLAGKGLEHIHQSVKEVAAAMGLVAEHSLTEREQTVYARSMVAALKAERPPSASPSGSPSS